MTTQNAEYMGNEGYELLNYMRILGNAVGYLVNFGPFVKLEWKRYMLREYITQ
jgi:hypothetical protein